MAAMVEESVRWDSGDDDGVAGREEGLWPLS